MINQESYEMWKTFEIFRRNRKFTFREMHVGEKSIRKSQRFFLLSFITLEMLKSASRALVQNKTFISL